MNILFICSGNTCRSPMAEALLIARIKNKNIQVKSAGISAANGDPISIEVSYILQEKKIDYSHRSQRINPELILWANLILTMTKTQKYLLLAMFPQMAKQIFTLKEYIGAKENIDIEDPYGNDLDRYRKSAEEIEKCLNPLLNKLDRVNL